MRPLHIPSIDTVPTRPSGSSTLSQESLSDTNSRTCYILALPAEIRNRIYEEILVHRNILWVDPEGVPIDRIHVLKDVLTEGRRFQYLPSEPALTRTCRKIREETLPVFYGRNVFSDTPVDLCCIKFLIYLTPPKRRMLKQIRISHWKYYAEIFLHIDAGPPGADNTSVRVRLEKMNEWLRKGGLYLRDDAIHFLVGVSDDQLPMIPRWVSSKTKSSDLRIEDGE